jgi:hypothetical protein
VIYAVLRAIIDSLVEWASKPREVRMVGGGVRFADRVRAEIRRRSGKPGPNSRGTRPN